MGEREPPSPSFRWPPKPIDGEATSAAPRPDRSTPAVSALSHAITQIERTWLGLVSPPWPIRAAEAGWSPDPPDAYCWRCGRTVGPYEVTPPESPEPGCTGCRSTRPPWSRFIRTGEYQGVLREAIMEVKFDRWRKLGETLGQELGRAIDQQLAWQRIDRERLILVPVPASFLRRMRMGIDHTLVLARAVQRITGGRLARPIRRRHGPSQLEVAPSQRQRNVSGSFAARASPWMPSLGLGWQARLRLPGTTVVVIDDVKTTGATMTAACRAILDACKGEKAIPNKSLPTIWAGVVGVTPERSPPGSTVDAADSLVDVAPLEAGW